jgi:3-oxoacyl-[acyl-carrier protein] reductase
VARHGGLDAAFVSASVDWCRAVAPALAVRGGSLVANVSVGSVAGGVDDHDDAARGGATAAVVRGIATEFGRVGVRANCVVSLPADADPAAYARHTLVDVPSADDVAAAVVFLASDEAAFVTGQSLHCDGGLLAHLPHLAALRDAGVATVALRSRPHEPVDPG